jgi:hypothetical protein
MRRSRVGDAHYQCEFDASVGDLKATLDKLAGCRRKETEGTVAIDRGADVQVRPAER